MAFLKVANRAISSLASGISDSDLSLTVATGEGSKFPTTGDFHITIEDEILKCTSRTGDVLTVVRAQEGTAAAAHASGKAIKLNITAGIIEEIQNVLDGGIDKTHLSQDFGVSSSRLQIPVISPLSGEILRIIDVGSGSAFSGAIDDNAGAHGGQGLDATHVPYDGDSNEDMFNGLNDYNGDSRWGQIVLHNTTRSNSRKIVSVDRTDDVIVTSSSTDDWADNDVITCESPTCGQTGYFDIDLSTKVPATMDAIYAFVTCEDKEGNGDSDRYIIFHPYEAYDAGKRQWIFATLANEKNSFTIPLKVVNQHIAMYIRSGCVDVSIVLAVKGYFEYADT